MSYVIRVWSDQHTTGTYFDIPHADIIDINIDDNKSSNDDPFEIVGRQAKATVSKNTTTDQMLSLVPIDIPVTTIGDGTDIQYCVDYFANLIQIINDVDDSAVFTGLAMRQSIGYDLGTNQLTFTISDSLYIWITIAKQRVDFDTIMAKPVSYLRTLVSKPMALLGNPLNITSVDTSLVTPLIFEGLLINFPKLSENPPASWYINDITDPNDNESDWSRVGQFSWVFVTDEDVPRISISYFSVFSKYFGRQYRCYYYRVLFNYTDFSLLQPIEYASGRLESESGGQTYITFNQTTLTSALKDVWCIPEDVDVIIRQVTAVYGENAENTQPNVDAPFWIPSGTGGSVYTQHYVHTDGQIIDLSLPSYGLTTVTANIVPTLVKIKDRPKIADEVKGYLSLFGLGIKSNNDGGVEVYPHLIRSLGTGTALTITDADVISFTARGTYSNIEKALESISTAFDNSDTMLDVYDFYYRDFFKSITATFSIVVPRSYLDNNTFSPFMPISVYGKTIYLNKWSEPLYNDLITLECFGSL